MWLDYLDCNRKIIVFKIVSDITGPVIVRQTTSLTVIDICKEYILIVGIPNKVECKGVPFDVLKDMIVFFAVGTGIDSAFKNGLDLII